MKIFLSSSFFIYQFGTLNFIDEIKTFSSLGSSENEPLTENCEWFFVFTPDRCQVLHWFSVRSAWVSKMFYYDRRLGKFNDFQKIFPLNSFVSRGLFSAI